MKRMHACAANHELAIEESTAHILGNAGFSLLEVLVAVAVIGGSLSVVIGALGSQARAADGFCRQQEARSVLDDAVERFQFGGCAFGDSLITGRYAVYELQIEMPPLAGIPGNVEPGVISLRWKDHDQERHASMNAWRPRPSAG